MKKIAIIGVGNMGSAILAGMVNSKKYGVDQIIASDIQSDRLAAFTRRYSLIVPASNIQAAEVADIIIVAVKPHQMKQVAHEIKALIKPNTVLISVAAGITIDHLAAMFGEQNKIIRVMPNTPALIGEGMFAITQNNFVNMDELSEVQHIFQDLGKTMLVNEDQMDAITGLSGSGPAFVYLFIEALADAGVFKGLTREQAYELASQTVLGSARMVLETKKHPGVLKDMVTSPNGTTITGVRALEKGNFRSTVMEAVIAAAEKSKHMAEIESSSF